MDSTPAAAAADPKLLRSSVQISYASDDGYRSQGGYSGGGKLAEPHAGLLGALDEIARVLALFGHEQAARLIFEDALKRAADWRAKRSTTPTPSEPTP